MSNLLKFFDCKKKIFLLHQCYQTFIKGGKTKSASLLGLSFNCEIMNFYNTRMYKNGFQKSTVEFYLEITENDEDIFEDKQLKEAEILYEFLKLFQ